MVENAVGRRYFSHSGDIPDSLHICEYQSGSEQRGNGYLKFTLNPMANAHATAQSKLIRIKQVEAISVAV